MRLAFIGAAGLIVAGCQTAQKADQPELLWARADCRQLTTNEMVTHLEVSKTICQSRATAASVSAVTGAQANSMHGAFRLGVNQKIIELSTMDACMAERGYLIRSARVHEKRCAR